MNNKVTFGQYVNMDSWVHRLDPRTKILLLFLMMIGIFLVNNIFVLLGFLAFNLIIVISTKLPLNKFLQSFKMVAMLLVFTAVFQILFNKSGEIIEINGTPLTQEFHLTVLSLISAIVLLFLYFFSGKYIKKFRVLTFVLVLVLGMYLQTIPESTPIIAKYTISLHSNAVNTAIKVLLRVINLISLSALLTLSTKPTDLNNGIEGIFKPFKFMKAQISIFAMMISIALRSIPTLLNESQRILKAQASRGVDFNEGKLREKINQIISLLVPMFVISYKKAEDLANAMEARGYIPGADRTKIDVLKYKAPDIISYVVVLLMFAGIIVGKVFKVL